MKKYFFLFFVFIPGFTVASDCSLFLENKICEFSPSNLVDSVENSANAADCQAECSRNVNCGSFTWISFSELPPACYLFRDCDKTSECEGECEYSVSGPASLGSPVYPGDCCNQITYDYGCQQNFFNTIAGLPGISDAGVCQYLCQNKKEFPDCEFFLYDTNSLRCFLLSSCHEADFYNNCVSGPDHPSLYLCSGGPQPSTSSSPPPSSTTSSSSTTASSSPTTTTSNSSSNTTTSVDTTTITSTSSTQKPINDTTTSAVSTSTPSSNTAVLIGGSSGVTEVYPCNPNIADQEAILRTGLGAAVLHGDIYYCGGFSEEAETFGYLKSCFKSSKDGWTEIGEMNLARSFFSLNTVGDKLIAAGGVGERGYMDDMISFDGSWSSYGRLSPARNKHCAVAISETEIVFLGGVNDGELDNVEMFSEIQGWTTLPQMTSTRYSHACVVYNGEIIVSGGHSLRADLNIVEALNLSSLEWRSLPSLNKTRSSHTMEVVNGELMVFGGVGGQDSLEILEAEEWILEALEGKHVYHASVTIPYE
ncbi:uncharacterized protein LOC111704309 [Eurytemora carolleeae]|uniref:uncharacterized protein LOC111704309 n=1 Tax=Eurytemora carolleeae TaxID=1294199 RepID=UPI000C755F9E|nr:uncharacterized protein LOC111704309 [Eurytemora carolleeae]|eukprot:XP_023332291.1 uncharacterized protein LOC111704309 [Eurytemora affinis]